MPWLAKKTLEIAAFCKESLLQLWINNCSLAGTFPSPVATTARVCRYGVQNRFYCGISCTDLRDRPSHKQNIHPVKTITKGSSVQRPRRSARLPASQGQSEPPTALRLARKPIALGTR